MRMSNKLIQTTLVATMVLVTAQGISAQTIDSASMQRLRAASGGTAEIETHAKTGTASFISFVPGSLALDVDPTDGVAEKAAAFFNAHGGVFGIRSSAEELSLAGDRVDALGERHLSYEQLYEGLPVFGGWLRAHFDAQEQLKAVNGHFLPGLALDTSAQRSAEDAEKTALARVGGTDLEVLGTRLVIYRTALVKAGPGRDYLVWEVEVGNHSNVRELLFVDARTGKVVDQITGIHESIDRRLHQGSFGQLIWQEGNPLPYVGTPPDSNDDPQINRLIDTADQTYQLFLNLSNGTYPSWDGRDGAMNSVYEDEDIECPNANWNGASTNFCSGVTGDDTVAHEWTHAYTQTTHALIYRDQPGALNESFSDIFGEIVDTLNRSGSDTPNTIRTPNQCSTRGGTMPPRCTIHSPDELSGELVASGAGFNPPAPTVVRADVQLVDDGQSGEDGSTSDGCESFIDFTAGRIALLDRGTCLFIDKVSNAVEAGAAGVLVANHEPGLVQMGSSGSSFPIPTIMISRVDGETLKERLEAEPVNAAIELASASDPSYRWLASEDDLSFGGAIRDLWNPSCFGDPGKVSDPRYACGDDDNGGVHSNSAIPNHEFALLTDGGSYNGQTIEPLGLTKAAHIFWRAMSVYQGPTTSFYGHADAVEKSCRDLLGVDLLDLESGLPSGLILSEADCEQVDKVALAVELRDLPTECGLETVLDPNAPPLTCDSTVFLEDFETDPGATWTLSNDGVFDEYESRDWQWTTDIPNGGSGAAFFAIDSLDIGNCVAGADDQSGVMHLDSPVIALPVGATTSVLTFDHWVATEEDYDGGNVRISVNGSGFSRLIAAEDYTWNPYNGTLEPNDSANPNTSPLAGEPAFHGANEGTLTGSWGQSRIDLRNYAEGGDQIRIRFNLGVDGCNGNQGWYVDNVRVCTNDPEVFFDSFESSDTSAWSVTDPRSPEPSTGNPWAVNEKAGLVGDFGYEVSAGGKTERSFVQTSALQRDDAIEIQFFLRGRDLAFKAGTDDGRETTIARALSGDSLTTGVRWELALQKQAESDEPVLAFRVFEQSGSERLYDLGRGVNARAKLRVLWIAAASSSSNDGVLEVRINGRVLVQERDLDNYYDLESFAMGLLKHPQRLRSGGSLSLDEVTITRR